MEKKLIKNTFYGLQKILLDSIIFEVSLLMVCACKNQDRSLRIISS